MTESKAAEQNMGRYALCGSPTEYGKEAPIEKHRFYIPSAGQLCLKCYRALYAGRETAG